LTIVVICVVIEKQKKTGNDAKSKEQRAKRKKE